MKFKIDFFKKAFLEIKLLRIKKKKNIIIFNFHQVSNKFDIRYHSKGTFTYTDFFEQQIVWLKNNFKVIPLYEAIEKANKNEIDDNYACITFDDGDKSIINSMKILQKHNIPATFFINSGYLDNKGACWFHIYNFINNTPKYKYLLTEDIKQNISKLRNTNDVKLYNEYREKIEALFEYIKDDFKMFVSLDDLKDINKELFHIGLHGYEHQRFSMMSVDWQKNNLIKNMEVLSKLEAYKPIFAIPFGRPHDWTKDTIKIVMDLGLEIVFADGGINYHRDIGYKRIPVDGRILRKLL